MRQFILFIAFVTTAFAGIAQHTVASNALSKGKLHRAEVSDGDTVPVMRLAPQYVVSARIWKNKRAQKRYGRLVYNVKKVYPYAKLAGQKLEEYAIELEAIEDQRKRKKFLKKVEKELKEEYEGDLRKMTMTQGRILIKLIDRETGNTSYALVKDLRGSFSAFFWQSLARIFGQNLKNNYDPNGADKEIEEIVQLIEAGVI